MKQIKKETVIAVMFTLCITIFFVCLVPTYYSVSKQLASQTANYNYVPINWEERYPFTNETQVSDTSESIIVTLQNRYLTFVARTKSILSSVVTNGTLTRYPFSELYCKLQKTIGYKRFESIDSSVLLLGNDTYTYNIKMDTTQNSIEIVESINEFYHWLNNQEIQYLYVMKPYKIGSVNEDGIF